MYRIASVIRRNRSVSLPLGRDPIANNVGVDRTYKPRCMALWLGLFPLLFKEGTVRTNRQVCKLLPQTIHFV